MFSLCNIFSLFFLSNPFFQATDTLPKQIVASLDNWNKNYPTEKVFLHTDKATYVAGENIWYKAYMMLDGEPTYLSKIMYVELVDDKGKVVEKQRRPMENGSANGDIVIPKDLPSGNYAVNAYSLWMLNFSPFVFKKNIHIYNYDYKQTEKPGTTTDFSLQFFPEGGDLVEGISSIVAFHAVNQYGLPVEIMGTIKTAAGKTVSTLTTLQPGYGKFELMPTEQPLTAYVTWNGIEKKFPLPAPKKEGVVLSVNNASAARSFVQVSRKVSTPAQYNNLTVVAQMYGKAVYVGLVNFSEDATGMAISKKNLPPGIMHITVFDQDAKPLAERLVFINNFEFLTPDISIDSLSLKPKGKNKLKIDLSKFNDPSVSVAVTDGDLAGKPGIGDNILSNFLLTSDLKGYIHNPAQYLTSKNPQITEQLDAVMLTHGWRRFKWNDVLAHKQIALRFPVESNITLSGKVTIPQSSKTIAGGHVDIIIKGDDSTTILSKAVVDKNGEFIVSDLAFRQKATIYAQGTKTSNQNANVDVIFNKSYIDTLRTSAYKPDINLDTAGLDQNNKLLALLLQEADKNKSTTLANITVTARKRSRIDSLNAEYASDFFMAGQTLELTSQHYISIWQFLREQVNGLVVEGNILDPNVYFQRSGGLQLFNITETEEEGTNSIGAAETNGITYYLNEINVSKDVINTIHPSDVAMVKVFKGPEGAALGMNEGGIVIYTKKGSNVKNRPGEKGFFTETRLGYAVTREFFNPDYSVLTDTTVTDQRTTLYWKPYLKRDKSGVATIRFYNNDVSKKYKLVVQGIDKKGSIIHLERVIE